MSERETWYKECEHMDDLRGCSRNECPENTVDCRVPAYPAAGEWCSDMSLAPRDGTRILIDDGVMFLVATWIDDYGSHYCDEWLIADQYDECHTIVSKCITRWARIYPLKGA